MVCKIIDTKLGKVEFSSIGRGQPILFFHGGHSNCCEKICLKGLDTRKYMLIIPSRPGYGKTPLNNNKSPKNTADLFVEILNYLKIKRCVVYGISAGGLCAIEMANNYPERVSKLILASSVTKKWLSPESKIYRSAKLMFNPLLEPILWASIRIFSLISPKLLARKFQNQFSTKSLEHISGEETRDLVDTLKKYRSKKGFSNDLEQNIKEESLKNITCPTLIIHSLNDNSVSIEQAEHAYKLIRKAKIKKIKNDWGHLLWIGEDSQITIKEILKFIEE